jgi:hypothetical protein
VWVARRHLKSEYERSRNDPDERRCVHRGQHLQLTLNRKTIMASAFDLRPFGGTGITVTPRELRENVAAVQKGPLDSDEMEFMCDFGDAVYNQKKWFM